MRSARVAIGDLGRRGTFTAVTVLVKQIRDYIDHWNADSRPFVWTATADDILAKVQLVQTNIKKLATVEAGWAQVASDAST